MAQTTNTVLMVRPVISEELNKTDNPIKEQSKKISPVIENEIIKEFDNFVQELRRWQVIVMEIQDTPQPWTPDSIFPNDWLSTHTKEERERNGKAINCKALKTMDAILDLPDAEIYIVLYPMSVPDRRIEKYKIPTKILKEHFGEKAFFVDLSEFEKENKFLEGPGSVVFDRENKIIYACRSEITNEEVVERLAILLNYRYFMFDSVQPDNKFYKHTDNILSIGSKFAIVCFDAIKGEEEKKNLKKLLTETGKEIIELEPEQVKHFAGNIIEINTHKDGICQPVYVLSQSAKNTLKDEQLKKLSDYAIIISPDLSRIENIDGGSAKCMLAEIFG